MSTKTTFKRIALVAVAALGFGVLSVAPSNAAGMLADTLVNAADGTATVASTATIGGSAATAKIVWSGVATSSSDSATVSGTITSVPATSGSYSVSFAATGGTSPDSAGSGFASNTVTTSAAGRVTKYITASFTPDVAGTYVISLKAAGGVNNSAVVWTITAGATPAATAASSSVVFYSKAVNGAGGTPGTEPNIQDDYVYLRYVANQSLVTALGTLAAAAPASGVFSEPVTAASTGTIVGSGMVHLSNATILTSNTAVAVPVTATTTRGYVRVSSTGGDTAWGTSVTETAAAGFTPFADPSGFGRMKFFKVMSDGTAGPATITISAGGVVLGTVNMMFTGPKASLALATGLTTKLSKNYIGSGDQATVTINGLDAAGNILAASGITAVTGSDATGTIATAAVAGNIVTVTGGLVTGSVTWTVTDGTRTVTFVTNTTKKTAATVALSLSNSAPNPGELVTLTVTAKDANGSPVADGPRQLFAAGLATNLAVGASTMTADGSVSLVGGVKTYTFYAPATPGTLTISALEGSAVDNVVAGGTAKTVSVEAVVANYAADIAQAATDAAAEAIDAANAATDAANAAAEAADAATAAAQDSADAVAALAVTVSEEIAVLKAQNDALRKQLVALTNLIIKIQKKVKA